jgi:hypothetical protein
MTSTDTTRGANGTGTADTMSDVFAVARRNTSSGNGLAAAASQVIARRVALGVAAAIDPLRADHGEFARMVPEKVEAFSAASMIMLRQSNAANQHLTRAASEALLSTARATIEMAGCASPAALAAAQGRFALGWYQRMAANCITMGMLAVTAQEAAMAPILQAVEANTQRLG